MCRVMFVIVILAEFTNVSTLDNDLVPTTLKSTSSSTLPMIENITVRSSVKSSQGFRHYSAFLSEEYLKKINSFWLQFDPPTRTIFYIFGVLYIVIFIIGVTGNMLVITMLFKCRNLLTPATALVLNLAVSDFIMVAKSPIAAYNNFMMGPVLGDVGCRIYGFLGGLSGTASILTLSAIAIDRYQVVVHPLDQLNQKKLRRLFLKIAFIWIYSLMFSVVPAIDIGYSTYVPEGFLTTCSFDYLDTTLKARIFMFTFFFCAYVIPFLIIVYCYFYILKVVICSESIRVNRTRARNENRLTVIVVVIIFVWFTAWTPYSIVAMLGVFGQKSKLSPLSSMTPAIFCKLAACADPYIYAASRSKFRMEFRRLFNRKFGIRQLTLFASSFRTHSTSAYPKQMLGSNANDFAGGRLGQQFRPDQLGPVPEELDISYNEIIKIEEHIENNSLNSRF